MSPSSSPRARRCARKLTLVPVIVAAFAVTAAPATAGPKKQTKSSSTKTVDDKKYGSGNGRKFK